MCMKNRQLLKFIVKQAKSGKNDALAVNLGLSSAVQNHIAHNFDIAQH